MRTATAIAALLFLLNLGVETVSAQYGGFNRSRAFHRTTHRTPTLNRAGSGGEGAQRAVAPATPGAGGRSVPTVGRGDESGARSVARTRTGNQARIGKTGGHFIKIPQSKGRPAGNPHPDSFTIGSVGRGMSGAD